MALALVNFSGGGQNNGPFTTVVSPAQNVTSGNSLVVGIRWIATSVTDNAGNVYQPLPRLPGNPSNLGEGFHFWYANNVKGNASLQVTATFVSTSQALDTFTSIAVWQISGGPLVFDKQIILVAGSSGTVATTTPFATLYPNSIVCLMDIDTSGLSTYSVSAPLTQDGGSSLGGNQTCGAAHVIYTSQQSGATLTMTNSNSGIWQIGGPIFGTGPYVPITYRKRASIAAAQPMFTGRLFDFFITLEKLWPLS